MLVYHTRVRKSRGAQLKVLAKTVEQNVMRMLKAPSFTKEQQGALMAVAKRLGASATAKAEDHRRGRADVKTADENYRRSAAAAK